MQHLFQLAHGGNFEMYCLQSAAYNARACVSDNHPSNDDAYQKLLLKYAMDSNNDLRICINDKPISFSKILSTT